MKGNVNHRDNKHAPNDLCIETTPLHTKMLIHTLYFQLKYFRTTNMNYFNEINKFICWMIFTEHLKYARSNPKEIVFYSTDIY